MTADSAHLVLTTFARSCGNGWSWLHTSERIYRLYPRW